MAAYLVASPCYHFHLHQSSRNRFILRWSGSVLRSLDDLVFYCDGRTFPRLLRSVIIWKWIKMIHAAFRGFFFLSVSNKNVRCQIWKCKLKSLMEGIYLLSLELQISTYSGCSCSNSTQDLKKKRIMSLQLLHNLCWLWTAFRKHFTIFLLVDKAFNIFLSLSLHC